jgi:hypothetical protein
MLIYAKRVDNFFISGFDGIKIDNILKSIIRFVILIFMKIKLNLLSNGISMDLIIKSTGMSEDEIKGLI